MDVCHEPGVTRWTQSIINSAAGEGHSQTVSVPGVLPSRQEDTTTTKALNRCPCTRQQPQSRDFQAGDVLLFLSSQLALLVLLLPAKVKGQALAFQLQALERSFLSPLGCLIHQEPFSGFMYCSWSAVQHQALHTEFTSGHWNMVQYLFFCI